MMNFNTVLWNSLIWKLDLDVNHKVWYKSKWNKKPICEKHFDTKTYNTGFDKDVPQQSFISEA